MSNPLDQPGSGTGGLAAHTARAVGGGIFVTILLVGLWVLEIVDFALPGQPLDKFGIPARELGGLPYIFTAPFLHYGFGHLVANSLPLAVLGFLAALGGVGRFVSANLAIIVVSGIGVWVTAEPGSVTLGASGLVFGYFGYLVGRGLFERRTLDIVVAVVIVALYGTTVISGTLPIQSAGISWQGHLFGLVGGLMAAWGMRRPRPKPAAYPY